MFERSNKPKVDDDVIDLLHETRQFNEEMKSQGHETAVVCLTGDLLHVGHIDYIREINRRLAEVLTDHKLIVGVEADVTSIARKKKTPIYNQRERKHLFDNMKGVDKTFISFSNQQHPESRPYRSTLYINPDVFVSHEEYYPSLQQYMDTMQKLQGFNTRLLVIYESMRETPSMRDIYNRSTTNTIKAVLYQHKK